MKINYMIIILASLGALIILSFATTPVSADEQLFICRGDTLQISARLLMNGTYGDPAPFQLVEFFDETNNCFINSTLTDSNGYASVDWYLPLNYKLGPTTVNATFRGNDTCALFPSYQQVSITIQSSTNLLVQIEKSNFIPGDQMIFTVLLTDDNANPLSNEFVEIFHFSTLLTSGKTNSTGHVGFIINCNQSWGNIGSNNITVIYRGDTEKFYASCDYSFLIEMNRVETKIESYHQMPYYFRLNDSINIDLILMANGTPLENSVIDVFLDEKKIADLITNDSGVSIFPFSINNDLTLGVHNLKFEYMGTERYNSSFLFIDFAVVSPVITQAKLLTPCIIGKESIVRIYLVDILGRSIQNTSILLTDSKINQSFIQKPYANTNYSDFRLQIQEPRGNRNFSIEVIGNDFIFNTTSSFILSVWSQPSISIVNSSIANYASPGQLITFVLRLYDYNSNYSEKEIQIITESGVINTSSKTDHLGLAVVSFNVPTEEGEYALFIDYKGNESDYELSVSIVYEFSITRKMPIKVEFMNYEVIPSLQHVQLNLRIVGFNGSALGGIGLSYTWLTLTGYITSTHNGFIDLYLLVPSKGGLYSFRYQTDSSSSVQTCNGSIILAINGQDAASSQGVGIPSIVTSIGLAFAIVCIPGIIRRQMVGL